MAVAVPPPLRIAVAARREGHGSAIRRGRGLKLVGEAVGAHRHRRSALHAHAIQIVLAADVLRSVREVDPAVVARPGVELVQAVVERQSLEFAGRQREDVDVATAGPRGNEGQLRPIGRVEGPRFLRGVGNQQMRFAAFGRHYPYVATGNEGDLRTCGTQRRLGEIGHAGTECGRGKREQKQSSSHKFGSWRPLYCNRGGRPLEPRSALLPRKSYSAFPDSTVNGCPSLVSLNFRRKCPVDPSLRPT